MVFIFMRKLAMKTLHTTLIFSTVYFNLNLSTTYNEQEEYLNTFQNNSGSLGACGKVVRRGRTKEARSHHA